MATAAAALAVLLAVPLAGQTPITFNGRIVHVDGLSTADLRVGFGALGSTVTRANGVFSTALPPGTAEVRVELIESDWVVLYPRDGRVPVPADAQAVPEIVVGRSLESVALQLFAEQHERVAAGLSAVGAEQQEIREILTQFVGEVTSLLGVEAAELEREIELQRQRLEHFPALSATVRAYILEARDLTLFFEHHSEAAFTDAAVYQQLADAVQRYNAAFQRLNNERPAFEYQVSNFWQSEELRSDLRGLYDFALGEVHGIHILQLNESLQTMRESVFGRRDGRRNQAAQAAIQQTVRQLNVRIPELERRADRVLTFLSRP